MIFSRIIYSAILVGFVAGVLLTSLQIASLNPIIFAAESYQPDTAETAMAGGGDGHSGHRHEHDGEAWVPVDGLGRTTYTLLANILASTGFAAMVLALMCLFWLTRKSNISWSQGSLWGLAGFSALFLAPAIGLPPEIPGMAAAGGRTSTDLVGAMRAQRGHRSRHLRVYSGLYKGPWAAVPGDSLHRRCAASRWAAVSAS